MKFKISSSQDGIVVTIDEDIPCLSAGHGNVPKILINEEDIYNPIRQRRSTNYSGGGTNSLSKKHNWDMVKVTQVNTENKESGGKQPYQQNRIYDVDGLAPALNKEKSDILISANTKKGFEIATEGDSINYSNSNSKTRGRVGKGVAQTLDTQCNQGVLVAHVSRTDEAKEIRKENMKNGKDYNPFQAKKIEFVESDTMNTITCALQKDHLMFLTEPQHKHGDGERIYTEDAPTIQARYGTGGDNIPYVNNIRRLTEKEVERLQTFPDNFTEYGMYPIRTNEKGKTVKVSQEAFESMSNEERIKHFEFTIQKKIPRSHRYKLCGNSVTTDIPKIIGQKLLLSF